MWRLLALLWVIATGVSAVLYLLSGNRKYLAFSWRLLRYGVLFALLVLVLLFVERLAVIPV